MTSIILHGYNLPHFIASLISKIKKKKIIMRSISYDLGDRPIHKKILRYFYYFIQNNFIDEYWYIHELNKKFFLNNGAKIKQLNFVDHCQGDYDNFKIDSEKNINDIKNFAQNILFLRIKNLYYLLEDLLSAKIQIF